MSYSKPLKNYQKAVYKSPIWQHIRQQVIYRDKGLCCFCGKLVTKRQTIHHIEEINETNFSDWKIAFDLDNLRLCHSWCHTQHHWQKGYYEKESIVDEELNIDYEKREF